MGEEIWKDVIGYEGKYEVSNKGRFKRSPSISTDKDNRKTKYKCKGKILNYKSLNKGYQRVNLIDSNGKVNYFLAHRLIAQAFIPNPNNYPCINHINGVRNDNRLENIEWCTQKQNAQAAHDTGLCNPALGEQHGKSKLKKHQVIKIKALLQSGISCRVIGEQFGVSAGCIKRIKNGTSWKHIPSTPKNKD